MTTINIMSPDGGPTVSARLDGGRLVALTFTADDITEIPALDLATLRAVANGQAVKPVKVAGRKATASILRDDTATESEAPKPRSARGLRADDDGPKREYRRYPGDTELGEIIAQAGRNATAVGDYYGVPKDTAARWLRLHAKSTATVPVE